jgi:hypothetical protein
VRHVYDLHVIREKPVAINSPPIATVRLRRVDGIAADVDFVRGYADFQRDMVYGERPRSRR